MDERFSALVVRGGKEDGFSRQMEKLDVAGLPDGDVLVEVLYSSLNYKDALAASGSPGVVKNYPHTPGIDAAGIVRISRVDKLAVGDEVIVTSYGLGVEVPGGYGRYIRVPAAWVVPLPAGLSLEESMVYGTAGFTAALSLQRLQEHGVEAEAGPVLVTGASGGVGSIAVALLAGAGYQVVAASGKEQAGALLRQLGADQVVGRGEVTDDSGRPLLGQKWAGVVDTVGGDILTTALKTTQYGGTVTCCGLAASPKLDTTVFPFILRGISLVGIDTVACPMPLRLRLWEQLAGTWKPAGLELLKSECTVEELAASPGPVERILAGGQTGRLVVRTSP